jgi:mRNA-degrading endonuclease RelE of RelBE toxin-antitoxin system
MDKITKSLQKLDRKEKKVVRDILVKIKNKDFKNLDVKKLKSKNNIFRVRKGKIRIIYYLKQERIMILSIERRSEKIYK